MFIAAVSVSVTRLVFSFSNELMIDICDSFIHAFCYSTRTEKKCIYSQFRRKTATLERRHHHNDVERSEIFTTLTIQVQNTCLQTQNRRVFFALIWFR